jgi:hypothetical protein
MRVATFLMVASGLVGCQTGQQYQADVNASLHARLSAYDGTTMAGFTARTGLLPDDYYPVGADRVFVIRGNLSM